MGSKLTRQSSLDSEAAFFSRGRHRQDCSTGSEKSETGGAGELWFTSLMLKSEKLPVILRKSNPSPFERRVTWAREIQKLLKEERVDEAADVLKLLRKDMGLEGTSLNDILYKNAAFLNLVDPISHELLLSLARDMQCPKRETDALRSSDKICRQLVYHLTPHSKWARHKVPRSKSHACLKSFLKMTCDTLDLSGIRLSSRDVQRVSHYLQRHSTSITAVDLSFTALRDDSLRQLLPPLCIMPRLATLAVNGNRLTVAVVKDLTEAVKDGRKFPSLAWVDLGNNVDIFTMPQPLLLGLRRRSGLRGSLPTIYESECTCLEVSTEEPSVVEEEEEEESWTMEKNSSISLHVCQR
ncbi:leucine-rich repeat-containing protein 75B isoform X2 [Electrophorus electricus]|uniref:leucine-rich repeat-containing protein 75B isoform X2 n=1 Tax=Electrophorus electricus TaxID=8005 RepID=UPI0015D03245|nr:leucine-rich repeat-containing protein 75B isoform X2 [Electrophorus electricus]